MSPSPHLSPSIGLLTRSWTSNSFKQLTRGAVDVDVGIEAVDVISERDLEQVTLGIWVLGTPTWLNNLICLLFRPFPSVLFLFLPFSFLFLSQPLFLSFLPLYQLFPPSLHGRQLILKQDSIFSGALVRLSFVSGSTPRFGPDRGTRSRPIHLPPPTPCCSPGSSSGRVRSGRKEERKKYTWPKRHGVECICSNCRGESK